MCSMLLSCIHYHQTVVIIQLKIRLSLSDNMSRHLIHCSALRDISELRAYWPGDLPYTRYHVHVIKKTNECLPDLVESRYLVQ